MKSVPVKWKNDRKRKLDGNHMELYAYARVNRG